MRYKIPKDAAVNYCKSCKAMIYWGLTENGKAVPLNPDGTSHFTTCPNARQHSRANKMAA